MRGLALLVALSMVMVGCDLLAPRLCTGADCGSVITFELDIDLVVDVTYDVEACLDEYCDRQALRVLTMPEGPNTGASEGEIWLDAVADSVSLTLPEGTYDSRYQARLLVTDEDGEVIAEIDVETGFRREQPNGPDCPPVCWVAFVRA